MSIFKSLVVAGFILISVLGYSQKEFFPIEFGKEWKYEYSEEMKTLMGDVSISCKIFDKKVILNSYDYFVMVFSYSDEAFGLPYEVYYRFVEGKGWYSYDEELEKEELVFPEEAKLGTKWSSENFEMEVTSLSERIETPGKNYPTCIVVKTIAKNDSGAIPMYTYYVEGIGSVGIVTNDKLVNYLKN